MNQIAEHDFTTNLFKLLKETFEGPPQEGRSAYLDKGAGLFQTLDAVTAEIASRSASPGCSHHRGALRPRQVLRGGAWRLSWRAGSEG